MTAEGSALTPEDDLFARMAIFNNFVTLNDVVECSRIISAKMIAGRPRHSLASLLISRGHIDEQSARAVQAAVDKRAAATAGVTEPAAEDLPPEPKPMKTRAPAGDSQITVAVGAGEEPRDERFEVSASAEHASATLKVRCYNLFTPERPAFEAACRRLLETGQPRLFADLREVRQMASLIIGELVRLSSEAAEAGLQLIVMTDEKTARLIRMISGDSVKTITR